MTNSLFSLTRMWKIFAKYHTFYFDGLQNTLSISFFAVFIGLALGLLLAFGRMSKIHPLRWICTAYVEVVRSTPLLVQAMIIYYGSTALNLKFTNANFNVFFWGLIVVGLNSGAYMSEVIRGGIGAVPGGQMEAARAIGLTHWQAMRHVVLPQAVRNILPAMANEFVTIIKETSVLSIIGVADIMFRTGDVTSITYFYFEPYIIAALMYFVVVFPLSKLVALFERRMNKSVTR